MNQKITPAQLPIAVQHILAGVVYFPGELGMDYQPHYRHFTSCGKFSWTSPLPKPVPGARTLLCEECQEKAIKDKNGRHSNALTTVGHTIADLENLRTRPIN